MSSTVTLNELHMLHRITANLLLEDPVYLPLFERIERELAAWRSKDDAISRARALAANYKAAA